MQPVLPAWTVGYLTLILSRVFGREDPHHGRQRSSGTGGSGRRPPEATATLDASDIALVAELGERRQVREGEYLYREGDVTYDFFLLISAEVDIVVSADGDESVIAQHGPGRFLGELNMLTGMRVFVSARVVKAGEVVVVPRDRLRSLMARRPQLGDTILAAFVARRALLMSGAATDHPGHRVAVLARVASGARVPYPDPRAARVAGPRP